MFGRPLLAAATLGLALLATPATAQPSTSESPGAASRCDLPEGERSDSSTLHDLESGGLERSYILRLPQGYERRTSWPLIVAYHGRGSTGPEIEGYSGLSSLPAVVAYPNGAIGTGDGFRKAWQGAPYQPPGVDDVAFTEDLLDHLQSTYCLDPARTYATGKSNGGGLVGLLACRLPDRFAAVAPVAAAFYPGTQGGCDGAAPVPVIDVHGTGDSTIPYAGDPDRELPAIPDWVAGWVERDACLDRPRTKKTGRDVTTTTWRRCAGDAEVAHVAVTDGGHVWPGADSYSGGGYVTRTIETQDVIWRFLRRHAIEDRDGQLDHQGALR